MSDDLLKALAKVAREERAAADAEAEDVPVFDEVARARMVKGALDELGPKRAERAPEKTATRSPFGARTIAMVSAIAIAAAILLFFGLRKDTLPPYALSVQGGTSEWRGEDAAPRDRIVVRGDGAIEVLVRPDTPVSRAIQARAFATREGIEKSLPVVISAQGVVRIAGRADELLGAARGPTPEEWKVVVVVGEVGEVPASLAAALAKEGLRHAEVTVVVSTI
jgi:hypothetical protein